MLFRLSAFTAGVLVLLALLHLLIIGLPSSLTGRITDRLRRAGLPIHLDAVTLSLRHGWVLHNVRIYSTSTDHLEPVMRTEKVYVQALPEQWTDLANTAWTLSISGKKIHLSPFLEQDSLQPVLRPFQTLNRLQAQMTLNRKTLLLSYSELEWDTLLLRITGRAALPLHTSPDTGDSLKAFINAHTTHIVDTAAELAFTYPPEINLRFDIPAEGIQQASARLTLFASGLRIKQQPFEQLSAACNIHPAGISLDTLNLTTASGQSLNASGRRETSDKQAALSLSSTLPAETLLALLPESATDSITRTGIQPYGKTKFDLAVGPAPFRQLPGNITLHMHTLQLKRNGISLAPLRFTLTTDGPQIIVTNLAAEANGGPLNASAKINLDSGAWQVSAKGSVPTAPIGDLLGGTSREWIDRFAFTNRNPDISLHMAHGAQTNTFRMRADVSARDVLCTGLPFQTLQMALSYSNRTFRLDPLRATGADRAFNGTIELDFDRSLALFDASSTMAPPEIAQIIAPNHPTVLTNFTFTGPVFCEASGRIDYSGGTSHAAAGTIRADAVSAKGFTATSFKSRAEARGNRLIFNGGSAAFLDGIAEGSGVFDLSFDDQTAPFRLDIDLTRLGLPDVIRHLSTNETKTAQGRLSASLNLSADASQPFWESATGHGEIEIKEGRLRDLPILGGFSRLIRTTLPGFSLFSFTTFYTDYELYDGLFHSDNLELGGTVLSAKAAGTWSPKRGLDFVVQAEPLRQTRKKKKWYMVHHWFADALKESTSPFFRLLEFKLSGPLDAPRWRLVNLPKEVSNLLQSLEDRPIRP